jgi:hypothetical protein
MRVTLHSATNVVVGFRAAAFCATLVCCPLPATAASPMQPGLWELRVTTTVARQAAPAETVRECLSQQDIDHPTRTLPKPAADCALTNIETSGNRMTYDLTCKQEQYVNRGRMELVLGSANYDGMADMKISEPGKNDTPMTVMVNARRIGDCRK